MRLTQFVLLGTARVTTRRWQLTYTFPDKTAWRVSIEVRSHGTSSWRRNGLTGDPSDPWELLACPYPLNCLMSLDQHRSRHPIGHRHDVSRETYEIPATALSTRF